MDILNKLNELISLLKHLRTSDTPCAWTKQQTFKSLRKHTLEESYEILNAVDKEDPQELCAELGDMLYHIIFYAQIAQEKGLFNLGDVAQTMIDKHEARRPSKSSQHLTADAVNEQWENKKREERQRQLKEGKSILDGITPNLPSLMHALKLQERAALVGFDWKNIESVFSKLEEECAEIKSAIQQNHAPSIEEEIGDLLFVCTNLARHLGVDPEWALIRANQKFTRRFQSMEHLAQTQNTPLETLSLEQQDELWDEVKELEKKT